VEDTDHKTLLWWRIWTSFMSEY